VVVKMGLCLPKGKEAKETILLKEDMNAFSTSVSGILVFKNNVSVIFTCTQTEF
jgi:hypothetical protein